MPLGQAIGGGSACVLAGVRLSTTSFYGAASPLGKKGSHWIPKGLFALKGSGVDRLRGRKLSQVEPAGDGALRRALSGDVLRLLGWAARLRLGSQADALVFGRRST